MTQKTEQNTADVEMRQIPYGVTDYGLIRSGNYYYIDKTSFILELENAGRYLFFIRPRRFGKTLLMSMLSAYYDISYKDQFEEFFKGTAIYENPTQERNSYLVLNFNFSQVAPAEDEVKNSFLRHIRGQANFFVKKYKKYFGKETAEFIKTIKTIDSPADILSELSRLCREYQIDTYVLIDEYDNFANTILSSLGSGAYHDFTRASRQDRCEMSEMPSGSRRATEGAGGVLVVRRRNPTEHNAEDDGRYDIAVDRDEMHGVHGEGFYRSFFNVLKGGTSEMEAPFTRILLTGVSPITLDDVTSGYNIGTNISLEHRFNRMLGFTQEDVTQMIEYYQSHCLIKDTAPFLLETLTQWYGNYLFSEEDDLRMYNPDMVLFFLNNYMSRGKFPKHLLDRNVRIDYGKLKHLIILEKEKRLTTNGNFDRLKEIIENGKTFGILQEGFPLDELHEEDNFVSLLFYFGLLTINSVELDTTELTIPNETIRRLYYDYIRKGYEVTGVFSIKIHEYNKLTKAMALYGEWLPLFQFITGRMKGSMSLRDLITGEKAIQAFLNVYLGLSDLYIIHSEKELNKGFADLVMEPFMAQYPDIRYSYIIEIKYMKPGEAKKKPAEKEIQKLVAEAEAQLRQYSMDEKLAKTFSQTTLVKIVLVFCGHEAVYLGEVK